MNKLAPLIIAVLLVNNVFAQVDYPATAPYTSPSRSTCGALDDCTFLFSEEHVYEVNILTTGNWTFSLCNGASYDTWLEVGSSICANDIGSNDDFCGLSSEITASITAGTYYVSVEGFSGGCGTYILDISGPVPDDIGVTSIVAPGSTCGLTGTEDVTVSIENFGTNTQSNFPVSYQINGGTVITESIAGPLSAGNTINHTFSATADLSASGIYVFDVWTSLPGDFNTSNDSSTNYLVNTEQIVENICILDVIDTSGAFNYNCNFTNDLCGDGYSLGDMTLKTSLPITINAQSLDSISFYLYYTDCGFVTDFTLSLNGAQIGTYTDVLGECSCFPSTYPIIYTVTDTAILNAAWSDTNTLSVIHNGINMAIAGYSATVYGQCMPISFIETSNDTGICLGASTVLNVSVVDSVALIPPYLITWIPATGLSCTSCQSPTANPTSTTTYMVTVRDSIGAQDSAFVTVTVFSSSAVADAGVDISICEQGSAQLNASGGTYYSWSPTGTLSDPNIANPWATPVVTTNYEVTVTNACGFDVDTVTVIVNPLPSVDAGVDTSVCTGGSVQLNATGGISYLWLGSTDLSDSTISNPMANPIATTTYTVEATDVNGCINSDSVIVSVGGGPIIAASNRDSICPGDTTQLFAYSCDPPLFEDGFEGGTFSQWVDAGGGYAITATNSTAAVGNYSLQLSGGNWNFYDGVYTAFSPGSPDYIGFHVNSTSVANWDIGVTIGDDDVLNNQGIISFYADWSGLMSMNGITSTYNANQWYHIECKNVDFITQLFDYYIDNVLIQTNVPFNTLVSTFISQIHLYNVIPGSISYYDDITIGSPCNGIDTTLSYTWTPSTGLSDPNIANPIASPGSTTSYIVVASGGGCSTSDTTTIYTANLEVNASSSTPLVCSGDSAQLSATASIGGATYLWSPGIGLSCTNCPDPTASPFSTSMYYVTATSGACNDVDSVLLTVGAGPAPPSCTPVTTSYCCGYGIYDVTLNTIANTTGDGIEGYQDYSCASGTNLIVDLDYPVSVQTGFGDQENVRIWIDYNNDGVFDNDSTTELVFWSDNVAGSHSGTVKPPFSAVINTPLRMRVGSDVWWNAPPDPCINILRGQFEDYTVLVVPNTIPPQADLGIAVLDMCQGIVSFTDQSLYNPTSWLWDFGDNSGLSASQNPFYTYSVAGTYTVTLVVTNPFGTDTISQQVVVNSILADFTVSNDTVAIGENVDFLDNSVGGDSWSWDFGDGFSSSNQSTFHAYMAAGTYSVVLIVSNISGCVGQKTLQILVLDCSVKPQTDSIIGPANVTAPVTANYSVPLVPGSTYIWTITGGIQIGGGQGNSITVLWDTLSAGQVSVVEQDSIGCRGDTVFLNVSILTSVGEFADSHMEVRLYPNPNRGQFTLEMDLQKEAGLTIRIYHFTGQLMQAVMIGNATGVYIQNIDLSAYARGIYYVQIVTEAGVLTKKVVYQ